MSLQKTIITKLLDKGIFMPDPGSVFIAPEVDPDRISGDGVTIYPGTRILGEKTLISRGTTLGFEAPATLVDCFIGPDCRLNGGFFQGAVFLGKNTFGSGAHVRPGTILEEEANAAHTVGLKHTILFPFVTLGSLINFCDCLMAGGTSRKDHSEVGSSYIHFNYTPNQDKATPSLLGNVSQGVMLNQKPIFLGGQGGLVGPRRIAFGCTTAAGTICRRDEERPDRLIFGGALKSASIQKNEGVYVNPSGIYKNNCIYIANLVALKCWHHHIRSLFVTDGFSKELVCGLTGTLDSCISERINRLDTFCRKLEIALADTQRSDPGISRSVQRQYEKVLYCWRYANTDSSVLSMLPTPEEVPPPQSFIAAVKNGVEAVHDYTAVIKNLPEAISAMGVDWLSTIEQTAFNVMMTLQE